MRKFELQGSFMWIKDPDPFFIPDPNSGDPKGPDPNLDPHPQHWL